LTALKPDAYSMPMAVKAKVGIPLGIVIISNKRWNVYGMFADAIWLEDFENLDHLPLFSDEGKALGKYQNIVNILWIISVIDIVLNRLVPGFALLFWQAVCFLHKQEGRSTMPSAKL
jgi:hypothetical protein